MRARSSREAVSFVMGAFVGLIVATMSCDSVTCDNSCDRIRELELVVFGQGRPTRTRRDHDGLVSRCQEFEDRISDLEFGDFESQLIDIQDNVWGLDVRLDDFESQVSDVQDNVWRLDTRLSGVEYQSHYH